MSLAGLFLNLRVVEVIRCATLFVLDALAMRARFRYVDGRVECMMRVFCQCIYFVHLVGYQF